MSTPTDARTASSWDLIDVNADTLDEGPPRPPLPEITGICPHHGECDTKRCKRRPTTIHLIDGETGGYPLVTHPGRVVVRLACERHDPGGYWFPLGRYVSNRADWLWHLSEKMWRGDLALERAGFA